MGENDGEHRSSKKRTMPTRRYTNLDPETKSKLLEASIDEFAEKGYNDASLNAIIKAAGISKGSLYYYFEDKRIST